MSKPVQKKQAALKRRRLRVRRKVAGTAERPRLSVRRSLRHICAQLVDDTSGMTLLAASSLNSEFPSGQSGGNVDGAKEVGKMLAAKAKKKSIEMVVFDRGGRRYHGRVKALAEAARAGGLKF